LSKIGLATKDIEVWTGKEVREALHTHVNLVVNDTLVWEQSAAYLLDIHAGVAAFVKNFGLNFTIPYAYNGEPHDYLPDFVARIVGEAERYLIVEIKGADWDGRTEIKAQAARRWCAAINATEKFGTWEYLLARRVGDVKVWLDDVANKVDALT
jgi:type III restriction enzyme